MAKTGTLKTNTITEFGVSIYGQLDWTSTQNIDANKDVVTWTLKTKNNPTGYYRSVTNAKVTINGSVAGSRTTSISAYNDTTILNGTVDVPHNNDGTKTFTIAIAMAIGQTSVNASASGSFALDKIPRGNTYALNKTMLSKGESATLTITKAVSTNKSTITWKRGTTSGTLLAKGTATSVSVPYDTITNGMQSGTNALVTVECISYNSSGTEVGNRATLQIAVSTGKIPLSLYDGGNGDIGVTIGGRATKGGLNVLTDVSFGDATDKTNIDMTYSKITKSNLTPATITKTGGSSTIVKQSTKRYGNFVIVDLELKASASISAGSNFFTGKISKWKPASVVTFSPCYYSKNCVVNSIWANGNIICRNTGSSSIEANGVIDVSWFYITDEEE